MMDGGASICPSASVAARQVYQSTPSQPSSSSSPPATQQRPPVVFPFVPPVAWATSTNHTSTSKPPSSSGAPSSHQQTFAPRSFSTTSIPSLGRSKRLGSEPSIEHQDLREGFSEDPLFSRFRSANADESTQTRKKRPIRGLDIRVISNDKPRTNSDDTITAPTEDIKSLKTVRVNVLVLGAQNVGKTTFIKRAPAMNSAAGECADCRHFLVDGSAYHANMIEAPANALEAGYLEREHLVKFDGAVILFDAMNERSLDQVPQMIEALKGCRKSVILVSSKTDCHTTDAISKLAAVEERAGGFVNGAEIPQVSIFSLESFQCIMSTLIRDMTVNKKDGTDARPVSIVSTRMRAKSIAHATSHSSKTHRRSNSDGSERLSLKPSASYQCVSTLNDRTYTAKRGDPLKKSGTPSRFHGKPAIALNTKPSLIPPTTPASRSPTSFLDMRESFDFERAFQRNQPLGLDGVDHDTIVDDNLVEQSPATLKQLVDRLLDSSMSPAKQKFSTNFLIFYRFFAAPSDLLSLVFKFYRRTSNTDARHRVIDTLDEWVHTYPGDFAHLSTRQKVANFLSKVDDSEPRLKATASQILISLESRVSEDDDTDWAYSDSGHSLPLNQPHGTKSKQQVPKTPPQAPDNPNGHVLHRRLSAAQTFFDFTRSSFDEPAISPTTIQSPAKPTDFDEKLIFPSNGLLTLNAMGPNSQAAQLPPSLSSTQSIATMSDSAQRQAALLSSKNLTALTKSTWRAFMAQPDEVIARELTRIDWIYFSAIRPRDMVRHATVPQEQRHRFPSLANVTRAVDHFNHLAYWVASLILLRDKAKHRAEMLEKLMRVARRLRVLNNYNALGAFVAAVKSSPIARLNQTKDLVREEARRDFCKLEILMGTQRGGCAYRLAWENTRTERIPFIFSHRRDIVAAECGNKTFVDSATQSASPSKAGSSSEMSPTASPKQRTKPIPIPSSSNPPSPRSEPLINFPKFTHMGDAVSHLTAAQAMPYQGLVPNDDVRALLLDVAVEKDDEVLYQRSVTLEPGTNMPSTGAYASESALRSTLRRLAGMVG